MGSKSSKLRDNIETVLRTSDAKSKWILGWYLEDRFRDQFGTLWGEVQNSPIVTIFDSWKFGRRIGLASLSQILSDITPILV